MSWLENPDFPTVPWAIGLPSASVTRKRMESLDRLSTMQMSGLNAERMTSFASSTVIISSDRAAGVSRKQSGAHKSRRCKGANLQSPLLDRRQIAPSSYERRIDRRQSPKCHVETIRPFD